MKLLVAGVGNVFLGDDGFGVEVVRRMAGTPLPAGVRVADFGIRGVHLAYELMDGYDRLILVDAVQRGDPPGTVSVIEPVSPEAGEPVLDAHDLTPEAVLAAAGRLGGELGWIRLVGCEPACLDEGIGLSGPVEAAIDGAVRLVRELLADAAREDAAVERTGRHA
ncbi:hydrogenase maturation protease [Actinomadura sp. 9N407]|uniref:hydrogenase maturation protease n=1 Tax=Actinomadura sp. 9N407 TaxID=3375154 RepID=UPI0037B85AE7